MAFAVKIPDAINTPIFLKFVEYYANQFKKNNGYGRWLHEYKDMETKGLFKPTIIRALYIKMLKRTFVLGYIRGTAIWHIGVLAQDAAESYIDRATSYLYKICMITGETALDDDDDEYTNLEYDEANQICDSLNEEVEEKLFIVKRL